MNDRDTLKRIEDFRNIFTDPKMADPKDVPSCLLSNLSKSGLPEEETQILKKVLSYCPEKFMEMLRAKTMIKASVAVSGIAYRLGLEPDMINGMFHDIIVAYGNNPELQNPEDELEIYTDEDDVWGEAETILENAEMGSPYDQYCIGMMYLRGEGVTPSEEKYASWISEAANEHYADAEYEMWVILSRGIGKPEDPEGAEEWLYNAAVHGNEAARKECENQGISLDLGLGAYCGKKAGKFMTADGPICSGCMPPEFMEFCAEVTKDAVKNGAGIRQDFVF